MSLERRLARQMKAFRAGQMIREKLGAIDTRTAVEEVRIACLSSLAETRGLWQFMLDRKLCTPAQYEDYLDKGMQSLLSQIEGHAPTVYHG